MTAASGQHRLGGMASRGAAAGRRGVGAGRTGFSLLEVILALAIFAGAVAVLGELARNGMESTRIVRDLTCAQLICESKLAEIAAGIVPPEPVSPAPVEDLADPNQLGWLYSVEVATTEIDGLLAVRVTVTQDLPEERRPVHCSLVRWMVDPNAALGDNLTQGESGSTGSSGGGASGGSSASSKSTGSSGSGKSAGSSGSSKSGLSSGSSKGGGGKK
jgi:general secretion pathway protein I